MQEKFLIFKAFEHILKQLQKYKEEGNKYYIEKDILKAEEIYSMAIEFSKEKTNLLENYDEVLNNQARMDYYIVMSRILSNQSLTFSKLENYPKSLTTAVRSQKYLTIVKELMKNPEKFSAQFSKLEEKLSYRIRQSWKNMPIIFQQYQFSERTVQGLQVGTLLRYNEEDDPFGTGFFWRSQIIMTDFDRDLNKIQGIIINKPFKELTGQMKWIGGPCEQDYITRLHNIPQAPGARKVIDGVYCDGDVSAWKDDSNYRIREFCGFATWFKGQLEGEIRNTNGWFLQNDVTANQVFNPSPIEEFNYQTLQF